MPRLGPNLRCVAEDTGRETIRAFFTEVFDAAVSQPTSSMDVFSFGGSNIGFDFVPAGKALSEEQQRDMGVWIEVEVSDVAATEALLTARGRARLEVREQDHAYFQVPGGPVFRLADAQE